MTADDAQAASADGAAQPPGAPQPEPACLECGADGFDHWPGCRVEVCALETYWRDRADFDELDPTTTAMARPLRRPGEEVELRARGLNPDDVTEPIIVYQLRDLSHRRELGIVTINDVLANAPGPDGEAPR